MTAKPMKTLKLHYPMIKILIMMKIHENEVMVNIH